MLMAELAPASFRGVRFLVPKDNGEEGRNIISHNYVDSSVRYNEDNGAHAPTFHITAILHGLNLRAQLNRLRDALNKPGPGTLNHPYLGSWTCSAVGPYKYEREDEDSGVIKLDLKFSVTGEPIFPGIVTGIAAVVSGLAGAAVANIATSFVSSFGAGAMSPVSRDVIAAQIQNIGNTVDTAFATSPAALQMISSAKNLASDPAALVALLASAVRSPVQADLDTVSPSRLVAGYQTLFDVASGSVAAGLAVQ
jgi:prophage DNA circulation protein